ncbi:MAG: extracellular solute-binding protein [Candidatus Xenobiia bacterium LiM19]
MDSIVIALTLTDKGITMRKKILLLLLFSLLCVFFIVNHFIRKEEPLMIFCGAAFKIPMEDVVAAYRQKTGTRVNVIYGGLGTLISQIVLSRRGDVIVTPSPDIMKRAEKKGVIIAESISNIAFIVPCINTQKGNPRNILLLKDLTRSGVRVGIANPEIVYIGAIAVEIIEKNLSFGEKKAFKKNIVTYAEDFNKLVTLIVLKQVDAIIGLQFTKEWYPDKVEMIRLKEGEIPRIGSVQTAVISCSGKRADAERFIAFLASEDVREIFRKYHYFSSADEAFSWIGAEKPIGGEFTAIGNWLKE